MVDKVKRTKKPRMFPPSMAGRCLRYTVMELLGFGRVLSPETLDAMHQGSAWHREFQKRLSDDYVVVAVESTIREEVLGVSGRVDAVIQTNRGTAVIEYKTVNDEKFREILDTGPVLAHWAQLMLYLELGDFAEGFLVVESRGTRQRLVWHSLPDQVWGRWVRERVAMARAFQLKRQLPEREIGQDCLQCDRWQRCFKSEAERDQAVLAHPDWEPEPSIPKHRPHEAIL